VRFGLCRREPLDVIVFDLNFDILHGDAQHHVACNLQSSHIGNAPTISRIGNSGIALPKLTRQQGLSRRGSGIGTSLAQTLLLIK
jgi:hypothetical protein